MAINFGLRRSWIPKVKPNIGCHSNISINMPDMLFFVSSWYSKNYGTTSIKGHQVTMWFWLLTYDLKTSFFVRYTLVKCTIKIWLWFLTFPISHFDVPQDTCLRRCHQGHHSLNMNGNIQIHAMTSLVMSSWSKWFTLTQFAIYLSYPKRNWSYHVHNMFLLLKFPKTVSIFDLWLSFKPKPKLACVRCPVSHRLWLYLCSRCTITTDRVMAILIVDLLIDLVTSSVTSWVCNT